MKRSEMIEMIEKAFEEVIEYKTVEEARSRRSEIITNALIKEMDIVSGEWEAYFEPGFILHIEEDEE